MVQERLKQPYLIPLALSDRQRVHDLLPVHPLIPYDNWDAVSPIFKFSKDVRTVIYTTNAIESLNSTYRKQNRQRSVFPSDTALLKVLYPD